MEFTLKKDGTPWKSCDSCRGKARIQNNPNTHVKPTADGKPFDNGRHLARVNREAQVYANAAASQCPPCKHRCKCEMCLAYGRLYQKEVGKVARDEQRLIEKFESAAKRAKLQDLAEPMSPQEVEAIAVNIIAEKKVCICNPLPRR